MGIESLIGIGSAATALIIKKDAELNKRIGWDQNNLAAFVRDLKTHGRVEVGWRESCGSTDFTHLIYREWLKVLKLLRKDGMQISEERIKHGNAYATKKGGFWNSIVYIAE